MFNSNTKQQGVFTPLHYYKKWRRLQAPGEVFNELELRDDFERMDESEQQPFEEGADSFLQQAAFLPAQVGNYLRQTNGRIT